jgi:DNA gyrase subunit B
MPAGRYASDDIKVLSGVEAVRARPSMYIGDPTGVDALVSLTLEPLCLAVDEKTGGPARSVCLTLHADDTAEVSNDGPGLSLGTRPGRSETDLEIIMTRLSACRDDKAEAANARWCGCGISLVSALAEWCTVTVRLDGGEWEQRFVRGNVVGPIQRRRDCDDSGTAIRFKPDRSILTAAFSADALAARLLDFNRDVPCVATQLRDLRSGSI